jgi:NAD(P)H dehydrogenase (quinone)
VSASRILVVVGTPLAGSLVHALADAYVTAARDRGAEVRVVDFAVDPIPDHPRDRNELRAPRSERDLPLDPQVAAYLADLEWAEHVVILFPQWWGTYPAALKAYLDRVLLSGRVYRYRGRLWDRLLTGRTARLVMTLDSPRLWNALVYRNAAETSLNRSVLWYTGIRSVGTTRFDEVRHSDPATRERWLRSMARLAARDAGAAPDRESVGRPGLTAAR